MACLPSLLLWPENSHFRRRIFPNCSLSGHMSFSVGWGEQKKNPLGCVRFSWMRDEVVFGVNISLTLWSFCLTWSLTLNPFISDMMTLRLRVVKRLNITLPVSDGFDNELQTLWIWAYSFCGPLSLKDNVSELTITQLYSLFLFSFMLQNSLFQTYLRLKSFCL